MSDFDLDFETERVTLCFLLLFDFISICLDFFEMFDFGLEIDLDFDLEQDDWKKELSLRF